MSCAVCIDAELPLGDILVCTVCGEMRPHGRPQPVRDDRAPQRTWRPGDAPPPWYAFFALPLVLALSSCSSGPLVRECAGRNTPEGPLRTWVQPCNRPVHSLTGCAPLCRRAKNACEAAQAAVRDLTLGQDELLAAAKTVEASCP